MTTAKITRLRLPSIIEEKHTWGVRLLLKPFPIDPKFAAMEIEAQVEKPDGSRRTSAIKIRFNAVPLAHQFQPTQVTVWIEALKQLTGRAQDIAGGFRKKKSAKTG